MTKRTQIAATLDGCPTCPHLEAFAQLGQEPEPVHPAVQGVVIAGAAVGVLALGAMILGAFRAQAERAPARVRRERRRPRVKMYRVGR